MPRGIAIRPVCLLIGLLIRVFVSIVREYVFYVFLQIQKKREFLSFVEAEFQKKRQKRNPKFVCKHLVD